METIPRVGCVYPQIGIFQHHEMVASVIMLPNDPYIFWGLEQWGWVSQQLWATGGMKLYLPTVFNSESLASEYPCLIILTCQLPFFMIWVFNLCGFDPKPNHAISFFQVPGGVRMGSSTAKVGLTWAEGSTQCNFLNIQVWSDGCVSLRASLEENHGASAMTGPKKIGTDVYRMSHVAMCDSV